MHELGIVFEIKKQVEKTAAENELRLQDIAKVVVEVGEASSVVPSYLKECWPAAIEGTEMEACEFEVEIIVATVECKNCETVYEYLKEGRKCPQCGCESCYMVTGNEFIIKEIAVFEPEE